ncbi:hypothetical protein BC1002_2427 [Paraburkholderia atlantica]|uniref:Uncharacterized protein n=1 Tax=Paraburkholderia atlantica TaxID=2654982 RepID=D5WBV1_PARAM|nr:hypothetical protein [Paraburkholderia atlantica]ADG16479.1 hypothetical protein BC1002_2427 [Paraburkholderia atlantica]
MAKQPTIPAINVLLAYAALQDSDQELFNRMLNEFTFASPLRRREFIEQWRRELASAGTTLIMSMHDRPSGR